MSRRAYVRLARVAAQTQQVVPRVRRFRDLQNQLEKLNTKDAQTFEEDGIIYVHRCTKRPRLSREEKEEVCIAFQNYLLFS